MKILALVLACWCLSAQAQLPASGTPGAPADPRYCGEPARYSNGVIKRSAAVLRAFVEVFPCPKSCAWPGCKDRWERICHSSPRRAP